MVDQNNAMKRLAIIGFAAILMTLISGCGQKTGSPEDVPPEGVIRLSDQFSSDFSLINQDGETLSDEDFTGKIVVVYFGFATCPDVCPLALGTLSAALNELSEAERAELAPLFITVDPERDTPEALKAYLAFDPRLTGLTGTPEAAESARQAFKVYAQKERLADSEIDYTMNHTSLFYLVDRTGSPRFALHDTLTPQELAAMLRRAIRW